MVAVVATLRAALVCVELYAPRTRACRKERHAHLPKVLAKSTMFLSSSTRAEICGGGHARASSFNVGVPLRNLASRHHRTQQAAGATHVSAEDVKEDDGDANQSERHKRDLGGGG